jgi:hypothetical protein
MPSESPAEIVPTSPKAARSHHAWFGSVVPRSRSAGAARATIPVMSGVSFHPMPGLGPARQLRTISARRPSTARCGRSSTGLTRCSGGWLRRCEILTGGETPNACTRSTKSSASSAYRWWTAGVSSRERLRGASTRAGKRRKQPVPPRSYGIEPPPGRRHKGARGGPFFGAQLPAEGMHMSRVLHKAKGFTCG